MEKDGGRWMGDWLFIIFSSVELTFFAMNMQHFYNLKNCFNKSELCFSHSKEYSVGVWKENKSMYQYIKMSTLYQMKNQDEKSIKMVLCLKCVTATLEGDWQFHTKLNSLTIQPAILFLGTHPSESKTGSHKNLYTNVYRSFIHNH